jgi:hypothetical protein
MATEPHHPAGSGRKRRGGFWLSPILLCAMFGLMAGSALAQQVPDLGADITVRRPAFAQKAGPVVAIDGGHHNFHTIYNRFAPFAALLGQDGFRVTGFSKPFNARTLSGINILVIANALNGANQDHWVLPTPSAFTPAEIAAVKTWVSGGGALLLIADHHPFAGAASDLAAAFGFRFVNGFALDDPIRASDIFTVENGTLKDDVITRGRNADEAIASLATFTGSAFKAPPGARPIIAFPRTFLVLTPAIAWDFSATTPRRPAFGYLQGAVMPVGKGRLAVFGEAGMFSAQVDAHDRAVKIGFNAPEARQNKQFVLNVAHWLAGIVPHQ